MTDQNAPIRKAHVAATEHLTGIKANAEQHQRLVEQHLIGTQRPAGGTLSDDRY